MAQLDIEIGERTTWGEVFDVLALSEQSCIRDVLSDTQFNSTLRQPVLSEGETPEDWEVSIFSCLTPETARGVLLSMMLAGIEEDADFELNDQDASCLQGSVAHIDVAALIAESDAYSAIGEELFADFMRCIPGLFLSLIFEVDVELSEEEASCVRAWASDVDVVAIVSNPDDPAIAADFVADLISCVPDVFLAAMLEETGVVLEELSDDEAFCVREWAADVDVATIISSSDDPAMAADFIAGLISCVPDVFLGAMLEGSGVGLEELSEEELSCLRDWVTGADWTEQIAAVNANDSSAGLEQALELFACVPRLGSPESTSPPEVVATAAPTVAPVADGTPTPAAGGEVEAYARECQQATASLDVALAMIESEGSGEDLTWGEFAEILSAVSSAYRELQPPPDLREYHDAQLRALDGLLDHALSRLGSESFVEEFALAFAELFGLVFEVAFDPEKTDEEKEMLIEEATEELLSAIFGIAFMDAVAELEEIESQLSEDTVEVLYAFGCGQSVSGDFAGDSAVQPEVPVTDDYVDAFESAAPVMVGASVDGALGDDGEVDVFVFDAEEGELYEVDVALGNLSDSVATLYGPDGEWLASNDDYGDSFASRLIWKAPSSGEYYVEVSGYGDTGTYTLTVSLSDIADDHGGDLESATSITVGESIEGSVDYDNDVDFFVFEAEEGQLYQIDVALGTLSDSVVTLYGPGGGWLASNDDFEDSLASRVTWEVFGTGSYYVQVTGYGTGTYTLTVVLPEMVQSRKDAREEALIVTELGPIGVMAPLSGGPGETIGTASVQVMQMAVDEINASGGINGHVLHLIVEDSKCNTEDAIAAYNTLVDVHGVKIILGPTCSGALLGAAPLAEEDGVVFFSASATNPNIAEAGGYIFRNALSDAQLGDDAGNLLWADGVRELATITESGGNYNDWAENARKTTVTQFEDLGGELVGEEQARWDHTDFRSQLNRLSDAHPDGILISVVSDSAGGTIVKQLRELGYDGPLYAGYLPLEVEALEIAGEAATGLKAVDTKLDPANDKAQEVLANFRQRYGHMTVPWYSWYVGAAYDSVYIAAECLKKTNDARDADGFRDCLYDITWSGAIGDEYSFDDRGEVVGLSNMVIQVLPVAERTEDNEGYAILGSVPTPDSTPATAADANTDRAALVALYNATDGENWFFQRNWLSDEPIGQWHGVVVNADGRVSELTLGGINLNGDIPSDLGDLEALTLLWLDYNDLSGQIPPELGRLTYLKSLDLGSNDLSGEIPPELGRLTNLRFLDLADNDLSGEIPPELGSLDGLLSLELGGNRLTGCLPARLNEVLLIDLDDLGIPFCSDAEVPMVTSPFGNMVVFEDPWGHMQIEVPADWAAQPRSDDTFTFIDLQGGGNVLSISKLDSSGVPLELFASIFESGLVDEHGRENVTAKVGSTPQGDPAAWFDVTPDGGLSQKMMYVPVTDSEAFLIVYVFVAGQFDEGKDLASYSFDTFRVKPTTLGASLAPMPKVNRDTVERRVPSHAT